MKYFETEQVHSYDYEFYKGKWDGKTFRKEDSIFLDDNTLNANKGFEDALFIAVPEFNSFKNTEISEAQWVKLGEAIPKDDLTSLAIFYEANEWLKDVFAEYGCFTILGI